MAARIAIDPDIIAAHAGRVDQVAADVALAQSAASSIDFGAGAFGIMCAFLVPPATLVGAAASSTLSAAHAMVQRSATELRGIASDFSTTEEAIVTDLKTAIAALE
jgi:hypothetical protein